MKKYFFITDDRGGKNLWDDKGKIGDFKSLHDNVQQVDGVWKKNGSAKWILTLEKEELAERARKHPNFGKDFEEIDALPVTGKFNTLKQRHDPNSPENAKSNVDDAKAELMKKMKRYAQISSQIQKQGGEIIKNADPDLVNEFNQLKTELEIGSETE